MDTLTHLIYSSHAAQALDKAELLSLLKKARTANAALGITGMLLCEGHNFFQVLEGRASAVAALFAKIAVDSRHQGVVQIIQEPIAGRSFGEWTMSFSDITRAELEAIDGLNDFFEENSVFAQLDSGRAKKLLAAFQGGRWRRKLSPSEAEP